MPEMSEQTKKQKLPLEQKAIIILMGRNLYYKYHIKTDQDFDNVKKFLQDLKIE